MTRKLTDADRTAIDLVFDRLNAHASGNGNGGNDGSENYITMSHTVADDRRLNAVQQIIKTLDAMPAQDPPADLAVRTLQRIARATGNASLPGVSTPLIDPSQPMA